jgi:hypothetical protein
MPGQRPAFRIIQKENEDPSSGWRELGACWALANSENFSVRLETAEGPVKALMVPNKPRQAANGNAKQASRPAAKRSGPPDRRPAA